MPDTINAAQLNRLIGTHDAPAIVDVRIDNDDIGGVVTSAKGPEPGAWVIA